MSALDDLLALEGDLVHGRTTSVLCGMTSRRKRHAEARGESLGARRERQRWLNGWGRL